MIRIQRVAVGLSLAAGALTLLWLEVRYGGLYVSTALLVALLSGALYELYGMMRGADMPCHARTAIFGGDVLSCAHIGAAEKSDSAIKCTSAQNRRHER